MLSTKSSSTIFNDYLHYLSLKVGRYHFFPLYSFLNKALLNRVQNINEKEHEYEHQPEYLDGLGEKFENYNAKNSNNVNSQQTLHYYSDKTNYLSTKESLNNNFTTGEQKYTSLHNQSPIRNPNFNNKKTLSRHSSYAQLRFKNNF